MTSPSEPGPRPGRAAIVGTGLIGGSIGLALRARGWRVTGRDVDPARAERALALGALDSIGTDADADITFVCTPVSAVAEEVQAVLGALGAGGVVTDVAGVKHPVVSAVGHARFVGGHPMAGSEQEGVDGADATLFEGATWVLTPTSGTDDGALAAVRSVVSSLGADVVALPPERHDELVAQVSHVPHLTAAALMGLAADGAREQSALLRLAAGGFRDMTRVAAGHPGIWPDICAENRVAIAGGLDRLIGTLGDLKAQVVSRDRAGLLAILEDARAARANLPGPLARPDDLVEIRVPVPDRPGVLAEITTVLGELDVNIEDLEIAHSAEGPRGVLVLVVQRTFADLVRRVLVDRDYRPSLRPVEAPPVAAVARHGRPANQEGGEAPGTFRFDGPSPPLCGTLGVPGDKSISHRALLLAALAEGDSTIRGLSTGADVASTRQAVRAIGADIQGERVSGGRGRLHEAAQVIDVGNSGTTIRLMAGLCAGFDWLTVMQGDESLGRRPMDRVAAPLRLMGARVEGRTTRDLPPLAVVGGQLRGIDYTLPVASAQVKSAVLLAGLSADGPTVVREKVATRSHTEEMLVACGAALTTSDGGRTIRLEPGPLRPLELDVPGDPSSAAYWVVAACLVPGSEVTVEGVYIGPGRAGFLDVLARMGALVERLGESSLRARFGALKATEVGGGEVPSLIDEVPVLAVAAALADGVTVFRDVGELRVKESDRIATMAEGLTALGVKVEVTSDGFVVTGTGGASLNGAEVDAHGDHRVAMALAVAALAAEGETVIHGWDSVATSYPSFEADLARCLA